MSYYGERNVGNHERTSSSSSSSSRKSKKSNNSSSEKANKQPQRGLGVAQLEKIRLHGQVASSAYQFPLHHHHNPFPTNLSQEDMRLQTAYSSSPSFSPSSSYGCFPAHHQNMMGNDLERANIRFGDSQPSSTPSWHPGTVYEPQQFDQPNMTRHFLTPQLVEDSIDTRRKKDRRDSNSERNGSQELDLELRL